MNLFDKLQSDWQNQPGTGAPAGGGEAMHNKVRHLRRKSRLTAWVLGATVLLLVLFFAYLNAFAQPVVTWAMALMLGSVLFRVVLELYGRRRLRRLDPTQDSVGFLDQLRQYYRGRKWVHLVVTPAALAIYGFGFSLMLPYFKAGLSQGFYTYVLISGALLALALVWLIGAQVRRELRLLRQMERETQADAIK